MLLPGAALDIMFWYWKCSLQNKSGYSGCEVQFSCTIGKCSNPWSAWQRKRDTAHPLTKISPALHKYIAPIYFLVGNREWSLKHNGRIMKLNIEEIKPFFLKQYLHGISETFDFTLNWNNNKFSDVSTSYKNDIPYLSWSCLTGFSH